MQKKAVELSINLMIMMALGLAVLVVLIVIFSSQAGYFSKAALTCESKGGKCLPESDCKFDKIFIKCQQNEQVCCINVLGGGVT